MVGDGAAEGLVKADRLHIEQATLLDALRLREWRGASVGRRTDA
jgi:hypothetical protein